VSDARFAYGSLDRVFHERARLAICSALVANPSGLTFSQLLDACALTDGNLNRHLHALAEDGIVDSTRVSGKGRPQTVVTITDAGRKRFLDYIDALESVVRDVRKSRSSTTSPTHAAPSTSTSQ
jgi:predicted ArsR family transcriptional regulator